MHDMRDELTFCCNVFLTDGKETDAMNYVSVLERINGIIKRMGLSNAASADVIVNSDEICLRMNICGDNYLLAIIKISNGKIIFKDILEDEFYDAVGILIRKHYLFRKSQVNSRRFIMAGEKLEELMNKDVLKAINHG